MQYDGTPVLRFFDDDGILPNNPALPVVILPGALPAGMSSQEIHAIQRSNGWRGNWTYTVFDYQHWHPDAHEALSVAAGWADLMLGGPDGAVFRLAEGDTVILPAGTGHRRVAASSDFAVCGCYPSGQEAYSTRAATLAERGDGPAEVARVALPGSDPVFGADGPLMAAWCGQGR